MREPDADWNRRERQESELQRLDRNFNELLQELRVAQTGVQILFAFLLTLAFTQRFGEVTGFQGGLYYGTLVAAGLAAPAAVPAPPEGAGGHRRQPAGRGRPGRPVARAGRGAVVHHRRALRARARRGGGGGQRALVRRPVVRHAAALDRPASSQPRATRRARAGRQARPPRRYGRLTS